MKKLFFYYFVFLFSLLSIFCAGVIDSIDGFEYLVVARNIYYKGEPTAPPYEYSERKNIHMPVVTSKNGKIYSLTGLGFSLAYVPAVAVTDIVYKIYGNTPPFYFPLENDWLILQTASFTNAFIGSILGLVFLSYFLLLGLPKKQAIFLSLVSILTTNLFVYTKHSMAHMMFTTFLMLSFLFIKIYSKSSKKYFMAIAGLFFGVFLITYNPTFLLAIPPLFIYYLLLAKHKLSFGSLKLILFDILIFIIGALPFILIHYWFENARSIETVSNLPLAGITYLKTSLPIGVFYEGVYGLLLSPGRSFFIYSPLLLIPIIFWHKLKKNIYPELVAFLLYFFILVAFYAKALTFGGPEQGIEGLWHGESSWGPRYLSSVIPLGMIVVGYIYKYLTSREKLFIFIPLAIVGLIIEIIGVLIPYQTKYYNLEKKFFINGSQYTKFVYSNLLPRYSPLLTMSKNFIKLGQNFPKTFDHGMYNLKFYDGIDFPFNVGPERWRVVEGKGYISFDQNSKDPVKELTFGMINHPVSESSSSASLSFLLNNESLIDKPIQLEITERKLVKVPIKEGLVKNKDNKLEIIVNFDDLQTASKSGQILGLQFFDINGKRQNMESIDVPYVSTLGPKMAGVTYKNWGGINQDLWKTWDIHTQTFERLPDLWWVRNLFYWDIPKAWILIPFSINVLVLVVSAHKLKSILKN